MANLNLQTVELTSSIATAPLNGPPSSRDYNEYQRSTLQDLASITEFLNDTLIPLAQALDDTSISDSIGIQGSTVYADTSDTSDVFFDPVTNKSLVVADSIRLLRALISQIQKKLVNISVEIAALETRTTSINQNDVSASLASLVTQIQILTAAVSANATELNIIESQITSVEGSQASTGNVLPLNTIQVQLLLTNAYADNNYTASVSMEDTTGMLQVVSFSYLNSGTGLLVLVKNNSNANTISGTIHAITKHF